MTRTDSESLVRRAAGAGRGAVKACEQSGAKTPNDELCGGGPAARPNGD